MSKLTDEQQRMIDQEELGKLGLRSVGHFVLSSGVHSNAFWDVSKLFEYPFWLQAQVLSPFAYAVGRLKPRYILGIPTGGLQLANFLALVLELPLEVLTPADIWPQFDRPDKVIIVDDVLSTGKTVKGCLSRFSADYPSNLPQAIVVLVNRTTWEVMPNTGIPIIYGLRADIVLAAGESI